MRVFILGAGKVGVGLARAIRKAGWKSTVRAFRRGLPTRPVDADLVVLAVRDRQLVELAGNLARAAILPRRCVCVHVAGALDAEPLAALRAVCAGVAQMHPMISFASAEHPPTLARGNVRVQGDPAAVRRASALARRLGMTPRTLPGLDTVGYHAAAGLVANGAAALAAAGAELLARSGVPAAMAPKLLGPLLRSVAENVEQLGFPASLTGPVRRGDAGALERHLDAVRQRAPSAVPLFLASGLAQLPMARALSDAPTEALDAVDALLRRALAAESS
jgi:predicted short-subunit dehydrogenase-like oxidoreductase (DUF2520 family)